MSLFPKQVRITKWSSISVLTIISSLGLALPSLANVRYTSLDRQLAVEYHGDCSTTIPSGTYRVQNGVSGTITATDCSDLGGDGAINRFVDTAGTYRCYGTMGHFWGRSIITVWDIEGAVSGYQCLDIGESYTVEMGDAQRL